LSSLQNAKFIVSTKLFILFQSQSKAFATGS